MLNKKFIQCIKPDKIQKQIVANKSIYQEGKYRNSGIESSVLFI